MTTMNTFMEATAPYPLTFTQPYQRIRRMFVFNGVKFYVYHG